MRKRFLIAGFVILYIAACTALAVVLGEFALHPARIPNNGHSEAQAMADRFNAELKDVFITAPDGIELKGWYLHPQNATGDAIIMLHGIGTNSQGMLGLAELFLSNGLSDSNIPIQQSEKIAKKDRQNITLWRVPGAGHCGAWNAAGVEYAQRVLDWCRLHRSYSDHAAKLF
jgi:hypothetical protein